VKRLTGCRGTPIASVWRMRASSPALARVARPAVPRPTPRARPPRPTLRSVDLEIVGEVETPPRRSSVPPPLPLRARRNRAPGPRLSRPEIAEAVGAAMRDLSFFETPVEAASFCLATALAVLPSLAGVALLHDPAEGGYVVVYARGPRAALEYGPQTPAPERHAAFGDPWTALVAAVQSEQRCVGALELVDPLDGRTLGESGRHALATIARHLADFLRGRELVVRRAFAPEQVGLTD
jgi:hypothetical protein